MSDINVYTSETGDLAVATPYDRGFISGPTSCVAGGTAAAGPGCSTTATRRL